MQLFVRFFFIGLLIVIFLGFLAYIIPIIYQWLFGLIAFGMVLNFIKFFFSKGEKKEKEKKDGFGDFIKKMMSKDGK